MTDHEELKTGREEILIVDDTPANLQLLTEILVEQGYVVRAALSGRLALRSVAAKAPHLIVLDVKMPQMDGYEVCRRLKADEHSCEIPVIFISALDETADKVKGFDVGGVDYISKPFQPEEVLARIGVQLRIRSLADQLIEANETLEARVEKRTAELAKANAELEAENSQRLKAQEALRESEKRFRSFFQGSAAGMGIIAPDGATLEVNPALCEFIGVPAEQILGKMVEDFTHPEDRNRTKQVYREGKEGKRLHFDYEKRYMKGDGSIIWGHSSGAPIFDENGKLSFFVSLVQDITARKQAEESLRAAHRQLEDIIDFLPDATFVIDQEKKVVAWNRAMETMTGVAKAEIVGQGDYAYALPFWGDRRPILIDLLARPEAATVSQYETHVRQGSGLRAEGFIPSTYAGQGAYLSGVAAPLYDHAGNLAGAIESIRDISEHKQAEGELRESEAKWRSLVENAPDTIVLLDLKGQITFVNRLMPGLTMEAVIGSSGFDYIPQDQQHLLRQAMEAVLLSGESQGYESFIIADDGAKTWWAHRLGAIRDAGEVVGFISISLDHTERKQADVALRESEERFKGLSQEFRTLLDAIPDVIVLLSPEMKVVWANKAAADAQQKEIGQICGKSCYAAWHKRSEPCGNCPIVRAFASGNEEEEVVNHYDIIWNLKAIPLKDPAGKVINVIEVASDITEKTRLRHDAERSSRLASLGELSAGVAHEINNPNAQILLNASMLSMMMPHAQKILDDHYRDNGDFSLGRLNYSDLQDKIPQLFIGISESAKRIRRIVEDLKGFASPADCRAMEPLILNDAVQATLRLTANNLKKATNNFQVTYGAGLPRVMGNRQGIEQVMVNLLINACQALPQRDRGICVATRRDETTKTVLVEVRDEGVGVLAEHLAHITDPFFTTRRDVGGTGLGLSVSARIMKEMGGGLEFSSTPGEGMLVTLNLPAYEEDGAE